MAGKKDLIPDSWLTGENRYWWKAKEHVSTKWFYAVSLLRQRKATCDQTQERHMGFDLQPVRESAEIFHLVINNNLNCKLSINFCDELKLS